MSALAAGLISRTVHRVAAEGVSLEQAVDEAIGRIEQPLSE